LKLTFHSAVALLLILPRALAADVETIPYRAEIDGLWRGSLRSEVRAQSLTFALEKDPPATVRQLERRAENDRPVIEAVLKARGYLAAHVGIKVRTNATPARVVFHIKTGPKYTISEFRVLYTDMSTSPPSPPAKLALKPGRPAEIAAVEEAEAFVLRFLQERGYPRPKTAGRVVERSDTDRTVRVTCRIDPGPTAKLGAPEVAGLVTLREKYVKNRATWREGDDYNIRVLEEFSTDLLNGGLFSIARVDLADTPATNGATPVKVDVSERPQRTVRAGGFYRSSEGYGGKVSWEHRNLFGGAELVNVSLFASEIEYGQETIFKRPDFLDRDLDLRVQFDTRDSQPDAYDVRSGRLGATLEKKLWRKLTFGGGPAYEFSLVDQLADSDRYQLISLPLALQLDLRDDELDPSEGWQLTLGDTPYKDMLSDLAFNRHIGEARAYLRLSRDPKLVLAARGMAGGISGAVADDVPADKRFYAGGGGTIRGYKYQSVGVLEDGDPVGGDSMITLSFELRAQMTKTLGAALFLDGGNAYRESVPDLEEPMRWGAGFGIRYFMKFAPLRADVAFPLNRREDIDPAFQLYFSLGQAF